jgi:hypothetical protein
MGELVFAPVRGLAQGLDLFQLLAPQFVNIFVECQANPFEQGIAPRARKTMKTDYKQPS